jgi:ABC-type dipeptide/oligopeptide/nickel transport system permease component
MSLIPTDTELRTSLILVAKLFGAAAAIAFGIKFGITAVLPSFRISAFDDKTLNQIALIAIALPSLMIALILADRTRKLS